MEQTDDPLTLLDETLEIRIETRSDDRAFTTILWVVVVDGDVYVRSVDGEKGRWYQRTLANPFVAIHVDGERLEFRAVRVEDDATIEAVSNGYRGKYPPGGSLDRMTRDEVLDTTLRLEPIS